MSEDEFDADEALAALRAITAQGVAALTELARAAGSFRRQLEEEGFEPGEAFVLARDWLQVVHGGSLE